MVNENNIIAAQNLLDSMNNVKRVRKDKSLIEVADSKKIILTEDNREVLFG